MALNKEVDWSEIGPLFRDGLRIMFGGFIGVGTPEGIVSLLCEQGTKDLTLIGNDTAAPDTGVGPLISSGQVSRVVVSHIGTNPVTGKKMIAGELDVELVPQGTLVERIRCGGAGLGGVLTPTGVGTVVEEGKTKMVVDGRAFLIELPLRADVAILKAKRADRAGNLVYERAARNFNPIIALAADLVIAEVDEIVEIGEIDPDLVMTPAALVDKIVLARRP
ncbi:acetate CoA-transferase subunit alpha [Aromatoleum bremense]|uniref:Acetate CoA-transferase subunit alpha n=1 Tax=Aromatoleum bremense TaxID=76115 RepID=A0ABX1NZT4_9RHOO|nr:acetate CoA-transferase subunit alpha [Aromatoleum bremense]NMG17579.1 acetate CoA-transferase subunit alpha [Aromatoleum bremense]QTQ30159.1 3-oxoacid-CoA-transferase, alpha subunit [Aromatoleum bremense]